MHGLHEQLAVLVRQAAQVDQETRREHTSFARAEIGHQRFHRVVHIAVRDAVTGTGRIPVLVRDPVQLSLALLQRLKRAVLLQGNHDRLNWPALKIT